jgi:autophagy-related protein 9
MALDEENLGDRFHDYDLEDALANASDVQLETQSTPLLQDASRLDQPKTVGKTWTHTSPGLMDADEGDDDVPASLLVEGDEEEIGLKTPPPSRPIDHNIVHANLPIPGPSTRETRRQWETVREHQALHPVPPRSITARKRPNGERPGLANVDPKEKALWRWANVENLDNFLKDVYIYFLGNGIWCIVLSRALNLL